MSKLRPQIRGLQFEIWCEQLFSSLSFRGYAEIRRNVHYFSKEAYRQVDLEYFNLFSLEHHFVILEMKYYANGNLPLTLNDFVAKKVDQRRPIENIVDELEERRMFVGADTGILVTNTQASKGVQDAAHSYGIKIYDSPVLIRLDKLRRLGVSKPLYQQISQVDWQKYGNEPHKVYL